MTNQTIQTISNRRSPQPTEVIDRSQTVTFSFNGQEYRAHPGDTIASALAAAGVQVFSRSFKYHRPRGLLCCAGDCPNCLVQIGDEMNVRACMRSVESGMVVEPQNAWPSLARDAMSLTALGDRFLPVGFYYKTFIRPKALWPAYEAFLRHAAGLGQVNTDSTVPDGYHKQYIHADVVVVGGGPAGLSAALAAAETGARVALFDENNALGGHTRYEGTGDWKIEAERLEIQISSLPNLQVFTDTTVLGYWEDHWLSAVSQQCLYKIRAKAVILATGAYEQPLLFDDNDLPGVMLGSAVQRLLHLYGVAAGQTAVIITANDAGWQVARDLQAAGIAVVAVVDQRVASGEKHSIEGVPVFVGYTIVAAQGKGKVEAAVIAPVNEYGEVSSGAKQILSCDLIALSVGYAPANGLLYQAGGKLVYDQSHAEFVPQSLPEGIFAAGRVIGNFDVALQRADGRLAGLQAATFCGFGEGVSEDEVAAVRRQITQQPRRTSDLVKVPGHKKRFLCYCEDVTDKDLDTAIAEGYDSIELLKRYSTISMGPCQGKLCSLNTIHLCARANDWTIEETGTTTTRPPIMPVELGALAGQNMEPVQITAIHKWHISHGAKMMIAGTWLRPEHYGDPTAEVKAVRERAGLIDVSTLGKFRFTGPGVPDLLDKIYINRWQALAVGRVRYGVMCNGEGVILDDGVTAHVAEKEWYTTATSSGASHVYEWIQWWLQSGWGDGVNLTEVTEDFAAFNLAGPQSRTVLQQLTKADISNEAMPYMHTQEVMVAGVPCRLLRIGFTGELSYEIHCPAGYGLYLWEAIMAAGQNFGILPFGVEAQRVLRLEKAHIIVGQDTDALTDPMAAGLAWATKLDKGDFLGQRPLRRLAETGSKQSLVGFKMINTEIVPEEGLQIVQPNSETPLGLEIIGWVTSSRYSPTLRQAIGLCWLPAELAAQAGAQFAIRREGKLVEAVVHHGAFYDPAGERLRI